MMMKRRESSHGIEKELLDQLLAGHDPSEVFGKDGLLDDLKKALSERILNAELDDHLDVERLEGGPANRRGTRQSSPRSSSSARSSPTAQP